MRRIQHTKEELLQLLEDNNGSYFGRLLLAYDEMQANRKSRNMSQIERLMYANHMLFVPDNDFIEYLRMAIPESQIQKAEKEGRILDPSPKQLSLEHLLSNETVIEAVTNHIYTGRQPRMVLSEKTVGRKIQMDSGLLVPYVMLWNRDRFIDEIPVLKTEKLGLLEVHFIDGMIASERQNKMIMSDSESQT